MSERSEIENIVQSHQKFKIITAASNCMHKKEGIRVKEKRKEKTKKGRKR